MKNKRGEAGETAVAGKHTVAGESKRGPLDLQICNISSTATGSWPHRFVCLVFRYSHMLHVDISTFFGRDVVSLFAHMSSTATRVRPIIAVYIVLSLVNVFPGAWLTQNQTNEMNPCRKSPQRKRIQRRRVKARIQLIRLNLISMFTAQELIAAGSRSNVLPARHSTRPRGAAAKKSALSS